MNLPAYDRLLARATGWGFDSARLRLHLRTALAACLAVLTAWALGLEHPQWAGMTVWAASQPLRGQLLEKSFFRTTGTVIGTAAGVGLVLLADGQLFWLVTGLAVWIGLCAGLGNLQRSFASYGTMLAGYSAAMVALLDSAHPEHVYALGWDRLFTALTGVAAALLTGWLFTPRSAEIPGNERVRQLCARLLRDLAAAAGGGPALSPQALAGRLSAMAVIEEGLDPHAAGSLRSRQAVRALRRLMNVQIAALMWLRDSAAAPLPAGPRQALVTALQQAAHQLETQADPHAALPALAQACSASQGWGEAPALLEHIRQALHAHADTALAHTGTAAPRNTPALPVVLHRDWLGARRALLRAFATMFLVGMLWVATGWSGGAYMLLGLSVMITVFSAFDNPAFTMRYVTLGQAMGVVVALACQWLAWPLAHSQLQMVLWMLPFIFLGALLFSHRRTMLSGYDCNMVLLLALAPQFPYTVNYGHSLAMGLAILTGPLAGWLAYRFILPVTVQGRLQGLRALMVHELQAMAGSPLTPAGMRVWRARLYHRLLRLVRSAEKAGPAQAQEAANCGLAALRVGQAIAQLHQLHQLNQPTHSPALPAPLARRVHHALQRLRRLPASPARCALALQAVARHLTPAHAAQATTLQLATQALQQHPGFFTETLKV